MALADRMYSDMMAILAELRSGTLDNRPVFKEIQEAKLRMLYEYLVDEGMIDEEFTDIIENVLAEE